MILNYRYTGVFVDPCSSEPLGNGGSLNQWLTCLDWNAQPIYIQIVLLNTLHSFICSWIAANCVFQQGNSNNCTLLIEYIFLSATGFTYSVQHVPMFGLIGFQFNHFKTETVINFFFANDGRFILKYLLVPNVFEYGHFEEKSNCWIQSYVKWTDHSNPGIELNIVRNYH